MVRYKRAQDPDIVYFRVRPRWARRADFCPATFGVIEVTFA